MKTYTKSELSEVLRLHQMYLDNIDGGRCANLSYSDLRGSDLSYSDLRYSDLRGSDLSYSDLRGSDLRESNLSGSDLRGSDLRGSDLRDSDLRDSDLRDSDLRDSDLRDSDLSDSDLSYSDLRDSDLRDSDLSDSKGCIYAQCSWNGRGKRGRQLLCVIINEIPMYFCGCFRGTAKELRDYIKNGGDKHRKSRMCAYGFVTARVEEDLLAGEKNE